MTDDDAQQFAQISIVAYAMADVIGARLKGEVSDPKATAARAHAFAQYAVQLSQKEDSGA